MPASATIRRRPLLAVLLAGLPATVLASCGGSTDGTASAPSTTADPTVWAGYTRVPPPSVASVSLPLADGSGSVTMVAPPDGLRVVYFGYTSCPDVCPTTMSDLKRALAVLPPEQRALVAVDMVTIDPDRDVPDKLNDYLTTFVPDGSALRTTDPAALQAAATAFGASYRVTPAADGGEPEVAHSADLYVIDDAGTLVLAWPFGTTSADMGSDLQRLLAGERPDGIPPPTP